jgi:ferredoxin, 2Fe-2S
MTMMFVRDLDGGEMARIRFVAADGTHVDVQAENGRSVMEAAVSNGVDGITAECGGGMMCATCHVFVEAGWLDRVGQKSDGEDDMLDGAAVPTELSSRLACQIQIHDGLDGLTVRTPVTQS